MSGDDITCYQSYDPQSTLIQENDYKIDGKLFDNKDGLNLINDDLQDSSKPIMQFHNDPFNVEDVSYFDSFIQFNFNLFYKVFCYKLIFGFVLGPIASIIVKVYEGKIFATNLGMWGHTTDHFFQILNYACIVSSFSIYLYFNDEL